MEGCFEDGDGVEGADDGGDFGGEAGFGGAGEGCGEGAEVEWVHGGGGGLGLGGHCTEIAEHNCCC